MYASAFAAAMTTCATGSQSSQIHETPALGVNSETIDDEDQNQQHQLFLSSSSIIVLQPGSFNLYYGLVCSKSIGRDD